MGVVVSFVGIDGSGKTTFSKKLASSLKEKGRKVLLTKKFSFFLLNILLRLIERFSKKNTTEVSSNVLLYHGKKSKVLTFFPIVALLDCWLNYLFTVFPLLIFYDYVITDRYFYDFGPNMLEFGYGDKKLVNYYMSKVPRPKFCFYLRLSGENAYKRKPEFPLAYLKKLEENYDFLFNRFSWIIKIDSSREQQMIIKEILTTLNEK